MAIFVRRARKSGQTVNFRLAKVKNAAGKVYFLAGTADRIPIKVQSKFMCFFEIPDDRPCLLNDSWLSLFLQPS